jgi:hypothetical protein
MRNDKMNVKRQDIIDFLQKRINRSKKYIRDFENKIVNEEGDENELYESIEHEEFIILMMENIIREVKELKGTE